MFFFKRKNLAQRLARNGRKIGMCEKRHNELLGVSDKDAMVKMYLRDIDFCLSHDFPNNEFIRANFKGIMEKYGVFLDEAIDVFNYRHVVALGETHGVVTANEYAVTEVYAKHDAELWIYADGHAFIMVDVFDNAVVHVNTNGEAKVCVNRYGGHVVERAFSPESRIKIREKNKKTY